MQKKNETFSLIWRNSKLPVWLAFFAVKCPKPLNYSVFSTEIQWNLARTNWPRVTTNSITFLRFPKKLELSRNHFLKDNCRQNLQFCTTIYLNLNDDHHLCHFYKQKLHFGKKKQKKREKSDYRNKKISAFKCTVFFRCSRLKCN